MALSKRAQELQIFADGLRAALGLCPLYAADDSFGGVSAIADPVEHSRSDEWFEARGVDNRSRDERWSDAIELATRRKMKMRATVDPVSYSDLQQRKTEWQESKRILKKLSEG